MTNVIVYGCSGKMGRVILRLASEREDIQIVAGVDLVIPKSSAFPVYHDIVSVQEQANVVIDFSHTSSLSPILQYCSSHSGVAAILCTTGYSSEQVQEIEAAAKHLPIFYSRNMSVGINLLVNLAKKAATVLESGFDIEIIEKHHNQKIDAPSGTALMIADGINSENEHKFKYVYDRHSSRSKREENEIGLHAIRGGSIVGEHEVIFAGNHETITLRHSAQSKELFVTGALNAALFMHGQQPGLYDMSDLIGN